MKLTEEEKKLILEKRKESDKNKPKKNGILKHELFFISSRYQEIKIDISDIVEEHGWFITKDIVEQIRARCFDLNDEDSIIVRKGTKFDCYIDNGEELWYDSENIGVEEMSKEWADKNLENIKPV